MELIKIPKPTLQRLPLYYRIAYLKHERGKETISSEEIGREAGADAAQVRKDLAYIKEYGKPGVGYYTAHLIRGLERILGLRDNNAAVIVGAGRLGTAIASYPGFARYGLKIMALFDKDPDKIGTTVADKPIFPLEELEHIIKRLGVQVGIITVPAEHAQEIADIMVNAGIHGIWNFAPASIKVPDHIIIRNEDLATGLANLCHYLSHARNAAAEEEVEAGLTGKTVAPGKKV